METNEVSFSLPTWKKQEIKSLNQIQEEVLYASSPYSLNDFKNTHSPQNIFGQPSSSDYAHYHIRKPFNSRLTSELALFSVFLNQLVFIHSENKFGSNASIESIKEHLQTVDLCVLSDIPAEWTSYYKNQIVKKVLFQYLNKCLCNSSLIDIIPNTNAFLRFSIALLMKTHLHGQGLIQSYAEELSLADKMVSYGKFFESLCRGQPEISQDKMCQTRGQFKTKNYLLKEENQTIYLYIYVPSSSKQIEEQSEQNKEEKSKEKEMPKPELKKRQTSSQKTLKLKGKRKKASKNDGTEGKSLWGCLCYLWS